MAWNFIFCIFYLSALQQTADCWMRPTSARWNHHQAISDSKNAEQTPQSVREKLSSKLDSVLRTAKNVLLPTILAVSSTARKVNAIGTLPEFSNQVCTIQGLTFNVRDIDADIDMLREFFVKDLTVTGRKQQSDGTKEASLAFGPTSYKSSAQFVPGVSNFRFYGGHSIISLNSMVSEDGVSEIFTKGNGLQYVKIGAENIRVSKAIEYGGTITSAYGFVDLTTPGNIPLEVVVGVARDPLMAICLRVSSLADSETFFTQKLGMQRVSFPLARTKGSQFERPEPPNVICMGYSNDTFTMILQGPEGKKKQTPIEVGTILSGISLVYDDSIPVTSLPVRIQEAILNKENVITSPDGYRFICTPLSVQNKNAVDSIDI